MWEREQTVLHQCSTTFLSTMPLGQVKPTPMLTTAMGKIKIVYDFLPYVAGHDWTPKENNLVIFVGWPHQICTRLMNWSFQTKKTKVRTIFDIAEVAERDQQPSIMPSWLGNMMEPSMYRCMTGIVFLMAIQFREL